MGGRAGGRAREEASRHERGGGGASPRAPALPRDGRRHISLHGPSMELGAIRQEGAMLVDGGASSAATRSGEAKTATDGAVGGAGGRGTSSGPPAR